MSWKQCWGEFYIWSRVITPFLIWTMVMGFWSSWQCSAFSSVTDFHAEFFLLHLSLMLGFEAGSSSHLSIKHKSIHSTLHDQIVKLLLLTPIYVYFFFLKVFYVLSFLQTPLANILMSIWKMFYHLAKQSLTCSKHSNIIE